MTSQPSSFDYNNNTWDVIDSYFKNVYDIFGETSLTDDTVLTVNNFPSSFFKFHKVRFAGLVFVDPLDIAIVCISHRRLEVNFRGHAVENISLDPTP